MTAGPAPFVPTATVAEVSATDELMRRLPGLPDYIAEKVALQDLARQMADHPARLLPHLVKQAMEICDAESAGVSVLDGDVFRWIGLVGKLADFEGVTAPRNFSPCGVCLDRKGVVLMKRPERVYDWIASRGLVIPEMLLVPLLANGQRPIGTLWMVAREGSRFDSGHARVLNELAAFTGVAVQMVLADQRLKQALQEQETLTREMGHRISNLFAITNSLIAMTARASGTKEEMAASLTGRMRALADAHGLVRQTFNPAVRSSGVDLAHLVAIVLRPYRAPSTAGPPVELGEHASNAIALVLHELATNAAKYGALGVPEGMVDVAWTVDDGRLALSWRERGGPSISPPDRKGFGSTLVEGTIAGKDGTLDYDWSTAGLGVRITLPIDVLVR